MAKRTVSFSDYEEPTWEEYTGEDPPPNKWFNAKATRLRYDKEEDQLVCIFEITDGDYAGWGRGWYAPFEGEQKWKIHVLMKALQGGATKDVTLDWENEKAVAAWLAKAKPVKIKTREYNDRISLNRLAPMLEAVPTGKAAPKAEAELPGDTDAGDDEAVDDDYTAEELAEMEVGDLEEILVEEFDLPKDDDDFPKKSRRDRTGAKYKEDLIEAILAEQEADDDEDGDAEGEGDQFEDGFDQDAEPEPEPEPEPAPRTRRSRGAAAATPPPAKATTSTRRRRG